MSLRICRSQILITLIDRWCRGVLTVGVAPEPDLRRHSSDEGTWKRDPSSPHCRHRMLKPRVATKNVEAK